MPVCWIQSQKLESWKIYCRTLIWAQESPTPDNRYTKLKYYISARIPKCFSKALVVSVHLSSIQDILGILHLVPFMSQSKCTWSFIMLSSNSIYTNSRKWNIPFTSVWFHIYKINQTSAFFVLEEALPEHKIMKIQSVNNILNTSVCLWCKSASTCILYKGNAVSSAHIS